MLHNCYNISFFNNNKKTYISLNFSPESCHGKKVCISYRIVRIQYFSRRRLITFLYFKMSFRRLSNLQFDIECISVYLNCKDILLFADFICFSGFNYHSPFSPYSRAFNSPPFEKNISTISPPTSIIWRYLELGRNVLKFYPTEQGCLHPHSTPHNISGDQRLVC